MSERLPLVKPSGAGFLGAPVWAPGVASDVIVLGCALDTGMFPGGRSAAGAPRALRQASAIYASASVADRRGLYDYVYTRDILQGVSFADAGDLRINPLRPQEALEALPGLIATIGCDARLVLLLGGDHSLTYWSTQAFADDPPALVVLDAHEDATAITGLMPHSGNVISHLETAAWVDGIVQYGLRGMVPSPRRPPEQGRAVVGSVHALQATLQGLSERDAVVSIDVDVLDPGFVRAVASPSPGGLKPDDVLAAVRAVKAAGLPVRMLEVLEFAPETREDPVEAFTLVQMTLRSIDLLLC